MDADQSLTGVWDGLYSYPRRLPHNPFTAVIIDSGGALNGSVHEVSLSGRSQGDTLTALISGSRSGTQVHFTKLYDPGKHHGKPITYEGVINADATEIEGTWTIQGSWSGKFLMIRSSRAPEAAKASREIPAPVA